MALKIMPHGRLQEWVAEEKGYFTAEGLDYSFVLSEDYGVHRPQRDEGGQIKTGAFETFGAGRDGADVSCACHWATSAAASERAGQLVTTAYSVANCAIVVPPESPIRRPEELAGVAIGVGYHSGSHFATVQALEGVLSPGELELSFQGPPNERLDALLQRQVPAATAWGVPLYIAQAFGFRTVVDATFMIGFLVTGLEASKADVDKYLSALRRAQMEIDLHPELYKHYHRRTVPEKYRDQVDVRAFGTGERIVFLPYTREVFAATQHWTETHHLFSERPASPRGYDEAALVLSLPGVTDGRGCLVSVPRVNLGIGKVMALRVFVAGGSGVIGRRLVPQLVARGHQVTATTTGPGKLGSLEQLGATGIVMDGLDAMSVGTAVAEARPDAIVHQMTGLSWAHAGRPNLRRPDRFFAVTNRLRSEGTDHLLAAAEATGVTNVVAQGFGAFNGVREGGWVKTEEDPLYTAAETKALEHLEDAVAKAGGAVLRYGSFYGPGATDDQVKLVRKRMLPLVGGGTGYFSWVHLDDAASATVLAVEQQAKGVFNIVDDEPAPVSEWLPYLAACAGAKRPMRVPKWLARLLAGDMAVGMMTEGRGFSNAKAKRELGWELRYPSWRQGFKEELA